MKEAIELMEKQGFNKDMGLLVRTPTTGESPQLFLRIKSLNLMVELILY